MKKDICAVCFFPPLEPLWNPMIFFIPVIPIKNLAASEQRPMHNKGSSLRPKTPTGLRQGTVPSTSVRFGIASGRSWACIFSCLSLQSLLIEIQAIINSILAKVNQLLALNYLDWENDSPPLITVFKREKHQLWIIQIHDFSVSYFKCTPSKCELCCVWV